MRFRYLVLASTMIAAIPAASPAAAPRYAPFGLELQDMDTKVKPGDSFFDYAEGTWLRNHPIPADKTGAGYNFELPDEIELQVKTMVEGVTTNPTSPIARKIGDAYGAWMDEAGIEARGLAPLKPYLAKIDAISSRDQLLRVMFVDPGYASPIGIGPRAIRSASVSPSTRASTIARTPSLSSMP